MRETIERIGIEADIGERVAYPLVARRRVATDIVDDQSLLDDLLHRKARIERRERILEDHLHLQAERPHLRLRLGVEPIAPPIDGAAVIVHELQDGLAERGLAGAGLA